MERPLIFVESLLVIVERPLIFVESLPVIVERPLIFVERLSTTVERPLIFTGRTLMETNIYSVRITSTVRPVVAAICSAVMMFIAFSLRAMSILSCFSFPTSANTYIPRPCRLPRSFT